jgi:hypothetical protein
MKADDLHHDVHHIPVNRRHETPDEEILSDPDAISSDDEKRYDDLLETLSQPDDASESAPDPNTDAPVETQDEPSEPESPSPEPTEPLQEPEQHEDEPQQPAPSEPTPAAPKPSSRFSKYFLYTLVAGLIVSALISMTAVLINEFSPTISRALSTTITMVVHTLLALFLVSVTGRSKSKSSTFILNVLLLITIASFATSVLGIWEILPGKLVADLYKVYIYTFIAALWIQLLLKVGQELPDKATRITSQISIGFTALLYLLLLPTAFANYLDTLPELLYRAMAATAIALATSSVLTTVFHRIYLFKHHDFKLQRGSNVAWDIILACIVLFFGLPIIFGLLTAIASYSSSFNSSADYSSQQSEIPKTPADKKTQLTQSDVDAYNATVGMDCTTVSKYAGFDRYISRGTLLSMKLSDSSMQVRGTGATYNGSWQGTLPAAVDKNCASIQLTDIKEGDYVSIYTVNRNMLDTRLIQKLTDNSQVSY